MSGTIMIDPETSADVRTIDFLRIVDALRTEKETSLAASRLLESVDVFGMNMICTDELDGTDFAEFARIIEKLRRDLEPNDTGFARFLADLYKLISQDPRLRQSPDRST